MGGDVAGDGGGEAAACFGSFEELDSGVDLGFLRRTVFGFAGVGSGSGAASGAGSVAFGGGVGSGTLSGEGTVCLMRLS